MTILVNEVPATPTTLGEIVEDLGLSASSGAALIGSIAQGTGAVARTVQAKLRDLPTDEDFADGTPRGFWTDASPAGRVWRPLDRVMFGGAATGASGLRDPGVAKGWLGFEANGFMTYFETTSQIQSWATNGGTAIVAASRASDLPGDAAQGVPMGVGAYVTNDENGATGMVWGLYAMANRAPSVTGGAIAMEVNVANRGAEVPLTPYTMGAAGLTAAGWLRTGGEVSESGLSVNAASVALGIVRDGSNANARFLKGIVFQADAFKPNGAGNGIAMQLAQNHEIQWVRDGADSRSGWIRSDATAASVGIVFTNGTMTVQNQSNQTVLAVQGAAAAANYLRIESSGAGVAPAIVAVGTDTNVDLVLAPQAGGLVRFGNITAAASTPANFTADRVLAIKDGSGTTYFVPCRATGW